MKKALAILVTTVMMLTLITACAGSKEEAAPAQTASPSTKPVEPKEPVTIKFYHPYDNGTPENNDIKASVQRFEAKNPDIKVEESFLVPGNSTPENLKKLDVMFASGEQIDVVMMPNLDEITTRAANGILAPLDDLYAKNNVNPEDDYFINPKFNGKLYGTMNAMSSWFVMLNQDALDEAKLPVPSFGWTWDDYRDYAKKLTKGEGKDKRYGTYFHTWPEYINPIGYTELKSPFLKDDLSLNFEDPSYQYFFGLRRAMEQDDKSAKPLSDVLGAKLSPTTEYMTGQAAMLYSGAWMIATISNTEKYPHTFRTAFAPLPVSGIDKIGDTNIGGNFLSIAQNSKNKDAAFTFVRFITTDLERIILLGYKKADGKAAIDKQIPADKKDLYNIDSLVSTMYDKRVKVSIDPSITVGYIAQVKKVLDDGFTTYMLDNKTFEETLKTMNTEGQKVIDQNKK